MLRSFVMLFYGRTIHHLYRDEMQSNQAKKSAGKPGGKPSNVPRAVSISREDSARFSKIITRPVQDFLKSLIKGPQPVNLVFESFQLPAQRVVWTDEKKEEFQKDFDTVILPWEATWKEFFCASQKVALTNMWLNLRELLKKRSDLTQEVTRLRKEKEHFPLYYSLRLSESNQLHAIMETMCAQNREEHSTLAMNAFMHESCKTNSKLDELCETIVLMNDKVDRLNEKLDANTIRLSAPLWKRSLVTNMESVIVPRHPTRRKYTLKNAILEYFHLKYSNAILADLNIDRSDLWSYLSPLQKDELMDEALAKRFEDVLISHFSHREKDLMDPNKQTEAIKRLCMNYLWKLTGLKEVGNASAHEYISHKMMTDMMKVMFKDEGQETDGFQTMTSQKSTKKESDRRKRKNDEKILLERAINDAILLDAYDY